MGGERLKKNELVTTDIDDVVYRITGLTQEIRDGTPFSPIWADLEPVAWPGKLTPAGLTLALDHLEPVSEMEALAIAAKEKHSA